MIRFQEGVHILMKFYTVWHSLNHQALQNHYVSGDLGKSSSGKKFE